MKYDILGAAGHLSKEATLLNRITEWMGEGIQWEPDPRHAEVIDEQLGLQHAKRFKLPGVKEATRRSKKEEEDLEEESAAVHRATMERESQWLDFNDGTSSRLRAGPTSVKVAGVKNLHK